MVWHHCLVPCTSLEWRKKDGITARQFRVNTKGGWQNTEVLGHLALFSSPEYLCALISPLACGGYDISIVRGSEMPLDGKHQKTGMHPKLPTAFPHHLPLDILKEINKKKKIKADIAQCIHPEAKRGLS